MNGRLPTANGPAMSVLRVASIAGALAACPAVATAQLATQVDGSDFERSGWIGAAFYEPALGRFDYCRQGRAFDNGSILTFTLDSAGTLELGLIDESWAREPGTAIPTAARLDDYGPVDLAGVVDSPTAISFPLGDNPAIVDAFRRGHVFEIVGEDFGPLSYGLTGTSASLSELRNCVASYREIALTPALGERGRRFANALAGYPEDIRRAVLDATQYADLISEMAAIQDESSAAFRDLIEAQPQDVQTMVWRVVRYPDLVDTLLTGSEPDGDGSYPDSALEAGQTLVAEHGDLIDQVHTIRVEAEQALGQSLRGQPLEVEATLRTLLDYPEIIAGMAENLETVEEAGALWSENSEQVWQALELAIAEIEGGEALALERWQEQIASNPDAAEEMVEAADAYVSELSAVDPTYEALNADPAFFEDPSYAEDPYPYWYGTPQQQTDYAAASWYPTPYYQDTGYSYTDTGELLITGLLSVAFAAWLFDELDDDDDYYWWGRYPHFSEELFINVEDNIIIIGNGSDFIGEWRERREPYLPDDWFADDGRLADRLDELGEFEREFHREERRRDGDDFDRADFLSERGSDFPRLEEGVARDGSLRDRFGDGAPLAAGDGAGERDPSGIAQRLDRAERPLSAPADAHNLSTRDLPSLQGGPNRGDSAPGDREALDSQLGTDLADRLTGGDGSTVGEARPAAAPSGNAPAVAREPERAAFDQFNSGQFGFSQRDNQGPSGGSQFGGGGLFGSGGFQRTEAPRAEYQPYAPSLPRSGGRIAERPSGGGSRSFGGGGFQRRLR